MQASDPLTQLAFDRQFTGDGLSIALRPGRIELLAVAEHRLFDLRGAHRADLAEIGADRLDLPRRYHQELEITLETASSDICPQLLAAIAGADRMPDQDFLGLTVAVDATVTLLENVGVPRNLRVDHVSAVVL